MAQCFARIERLEVELAEHVKSGSVESQVG